MTYAAGGEFYRYAESLGVPAEAAEEMAGYFRSARPQLSPMMFFGELMQPWEYELLTLSEEGGVEGETPAGWPGFLEVLRAGVPSDYAHALKPNYSRATRSRHASGWSWNAVWGYKEVIGFHAHGVPVEYVEQCVASGIQNAETICRLYVDAVPLEYVTATT